MPPYDFTGLKAGQRTLIARGGWQAGDGKPPPAQWVVKELIDRGLVTVHTAADGTVIAYAISAEVTQAWNAFFADKYMHPWDRSRRR